MPAAVDGVYRASLNGYSNLNAGQKKGPFQGPGGEVLPRGCSIALIGSTTYDFKYRIVNES